MPSKMAEFDQFPGHGLRAGGARKRGNINLSIKKHPLHILTDSVEGNALQVMQVM